MTHPSKALQESKRLQKFDFDDQTYTIRRNLMVVSSLALGSTFLSPLKDGYEVNMVIIKGIIDKPIFLYLFLGITCIYYMIWFYIHCKKLVVRNYRDINYSFMQVLASHNAQDKFGEFARSCEPKFSGIPQFISKGGNFEKWVVVGELNSYAIRNHQNLANDLKYNSEFIVIEHIEGISVEYTHHMTAEDKNYLDTHLDQYWRTRKEELFTTMLPLIFSFISLMSLGFHIYELSKPTLVEYIAQFAQ